jgi:hypothetical protein
VGFTASLKTWTTEILYAADLNNEFTNVYNSLNGTLGNDGKFAALQATGLITATGGVSGHLTGSVTGAVTGDVTGNITGSAGTIDTTADSTTNATYYPCWVATDGLSKLVKVSAGFTINPLTSGLTVGTLTSTGAFGCNGATAQPVYSGVAASATTGATNNTPYGYTSGAQADGIVTLINKIRAALIAVGIMSA